jgi:putative glutamine amidotransferase
MNAGILPFPVSPLISPELLDLALKEVSGLLLMGGDDIDPAHYNSKAHPRTKPGDAARDEFEIELVMRALEQRLPLLGICRGMQLIAVASGGSLTQHVPDLNPSEQHGLSEGASYEHIISSPKHRVQITPQSRAAQIIGKLEISVTSAHHQAVDSCGSEFRVSGRSPSGIAEILEHTDPEVFAFAVQSHPEAETGDLEPLLNEFFQVVRAYRPVV